MKMLVFILGALNILACKSVKHKISYTKSFEIFCDSGYNAPDNLAYVLKFKVKNYSEQDIPLIFNNTHRSNKMNSFLLITYKNDTIPIIFERPVISKFKARCEFIMQGALYKVNIWKNTDKRADLEIQKELRRSKIVYISDSLVIDSLKKYDNVTTSKFQEINLSNFILVSCGRVPYEPEIRIVSHYNADFKH